MMTASRSLFSGNVSGVYLDHQATDRPRPQAIEAVKYCMEHYFGNASALAHERGKLSRRHLEKFRRAIASVVDAPEGTLFFTSGATEGNNLVISSEGRRPGAHLVVSSIEHKCVLESAIRAKEFGAKVSVLPVDSRGVVDLDVLRKTLADGATLVSVMTANNEIGTIQPFEEISRLCAAAGARFHTDAAQAVGKIRANIQALGADYVSFTAHKYGGPQGIGAVICNASVVDDMRPLLVGGGQERGMRPGTTPIPLCAGMAAASLALMENMEVEISRMHLLKRRLLHGLCSIGPFFTNGDVDHGLCSNLNGGFDRIPAALLMRRVPSVHFSVGSACTTGAGASHVLTAIGLTSQQIQSSFRLSIGWSTTEQDIDDALVAFRAALKTLH